MTAVPFHQVEAVLLAELADEARTLADLAETIGRPGPEGVAIAGGALRALRARGLVRQVAGADGIWRWGWVAPTRSRRHMTGG